MKNQNYLHHSLFIGLILIAFSFASFLTVKGQSIDLKELKAQKEAESIKKFTDLLANFYSHLFMSSGQKGDKNSTAGLTDKATKIRGEMSSLNANITSLIAKLRVGNHFDQQFDKDVNTLLGSNKVTGRLTKNGGARKLLESVLNSSAMNNLKKNVSESASLGEFSKDEDVCKFIAVGIITEVIFTKKSATANDKIYEANGCHK